MKKGLLLIGAFLVLLLIAVYVLIPQTITVSKTMGISATTTGVNRVVAAALTTANKSSKEYSFHPNGSAFNSIGVLIKNDASAVNSRLQLVPLAVDSTAVEWRLALHAGTNPFKKVTTYLEAVQLKKEMASVLTQMKNYLEKTEHIYGIDIQRQIVKDTLLISTRATVTQVPDPAAVYQLIQNLKEYAAAQGARETGYPMLHVFTADSARFEVMVALPVDRILNGNEKVTFKRMIPGNILVTDTIKGGPKTIQNVYTQMELYLEDYHRTPPAIPFESLITDRSSQSDTTQWRTIIYYPVF